MRPAASILSMFAKSPIRPLQQHMAIANECTFLLKNLFTAVIDGDWKQAEHINQQISECESKADQLKTKLRLNLPKNLFLPFHRSDLLDLLRRQEQLANSVEGIAALVLNRKMQIPAAIQESFAEFLTKTCETSNQAYTAISELDELLEAGFRGRIVDYVKEQIERLEALETETDQYERKVGQILFQHENELPPIEVIFLYKLIDWIGDLADCAQAAGNRLLVLMAS